MVAYSNILLRLKCKDLSFTKCADFKHTSRLSKMQPIVCDNGTHSIKAGFAGHNFPDVESRSIFKISSTSQSYYHVGVKVTLKSPANTTYPIRNGIINNWNDMNLLWDSAFNKSLKVKPSQHKILMIGPTFQNKKQMYV